MTPSSIGNAYTALSSREFRLTAEATRPDYEALVLIAGWCGLRWGEVVGLRRGDIDLIDGVLSVYEAVRVTRVRRLNVPSLV